VWVHTTSVCQFSVHYQLIHVCLEIPKAALCEVHTVLREPLIAQNSEGFLCSWVSVNS
jgi:hypothetical protein